MIKLMPPKAYGEIKPLANSQGQSIRCTPQPASKKRRRRRIGPHSENRERTVYHV